MEYKIIYATNIIGFFGIDFKKTAAAFEAEVNTQVAHGWEPQGGVALAITQQQRKMPCLCQAMIKRR